MISSKCVILCESGELFAVKVMDIPRDVYKKLRVKRSDLSFWKTQLHLKQCLL